ncbi:MAG: hypothetical protein FJ118_19175 [Deltaproteobacteria bacterium]|nr:hypothetical protein [Deltaproteobacteria bacterium]
MAAKRATFETVVREIDGIHRDLARLSVDERLGRASALTNTDIFESHPVPTRPETLAYLKELISSSDSPEQARRVETALFGCMDLTIHKETSNLVDMLNFYTARGRMHVDNEKVPLLEVVPWLQRQPDFDKREQMRKECGIFFKAINNPMLTGILELTIRAVKEQFGFENYVRFAEAKKGISLDDYEKDYRAYLDATTDTYRARITPWVEEEIGRPFENLSRYHALYMVRIKRFDHFFPVERLREIVEKTFAGLGFGLFARRDLVVDLSEGPAKNPDGVCIGVEIPGEIHVLMKPVGGLIDVETLFHEAGHAFFLSHISPQLPVVYRRLYRSPALDETFAFLFMELIGNPVWLNTIAGLSTKEAEDLADLLRTKRLCLIRRHIGKFLAEKELHEKGNIKDSGPYCRRLEAATGFVYEPEAYLVDMESDFYSLEYLRAWAGAHLLQSHLEAAFGKEWFTSPQAGELLKQVASGGRRDSVEEVLRPLCGRPPYLPA